MIWLDVGWPVRELNAMSGAEIIVEARFDVADVHVVGDRLALVWTRVVPDP